MSHKLLQELSGVPTRTCINNYNNNNNYNNHNDDNNLNTCTSHEEQVIRQCLSAPLESTSSKQFSSGIGQEKSGVGSSAQLPPGWRYLKLDLFSNINRKGKEEKKLAISLLSDSDTNFQSLRAKLNSPWRNFKRKMDFSQPEQQAHYNTCGDVFQQMKRTLESVSISKSYQSGGYIKTIHGLSVVVGAYSELNHYCVAIVLGTDRYCYDLNHTGLSEKQRASGIIAGCETSVNSNRPYTTYKDLGL